MDKKAIIKLSSAWVVLLALFIIAPRIGMPILMAFVMIPLVVCSIMLISWLTLNLFARLRGDKSEEEEGPPGPTDGRK
jgi:hypothetical protein